MEIRAVNHRYLDVQFRMPEELRYLEGALREQIAAAVARGKLECRVQLQDAASGGQTLEVNQDLVAQLAHLNKEWRKEHNFRQAERGRRFCVSPAFWQARAKMPRLWPKALKIY